LSRGQAALKPRRTLAPKPNIPPKRDRALQDEKGKSHTPASATAQSSNKPEAVNIRDQNQRGRGRGRGARKGELVQSQSIFAEGIGDPLSVKRGPPSASSGYGGGGRSSGVSSSSRKTIGATQLSDLVKERGKELELGTKKPPPDFGDDYNFDDQFEEKKSDPYTPVVVPLSSCKLLTNLKSFKIFNPQIYPTIFLPLVYLIQDK